MTAGDPGAIWGRRERATVGPRPEHSREEIARAAVGLADAEGVGAVSMRRVAGAIGAGAASLYRYLKSQDELLELMIDHVGGEYELRDSGEAPAARLLGLAGQGRAIMLRHGWLAPLLLTRPATGPNSLRYLEHALTILREVDLPGPAKLRSVAMLTAITSAFVQNELSAGAGAGASARLAAVIASGDYPHLTAAAVQAAAAGDSRAADPGDLFADVIGNYLAGAGIP